MVQAKVAIATIRLASEIGSRYRSGRWPVPPGSDPAPAGTRPVPGRHRTPTQTPAPPTRPAEPAPPGRGPPTPRTAPPLARRQRRAPPREARPAHAGPARVAGSPDRSDHSPRIRRIPARRVQHRPHRLPSPISPRRRSFGRGPSGPWKPVRGADYQPAVSPIPCGRMTAGLPAYRPGSTTDTPTSPVRTSPGGP
jgi:hypothetical protein